VECDWGPVWIDKAEAARGKLIPAAINAPPIRTCRREISGLSLVVGWGIRTFSMSRIRVRLLRWTRFHQWAGSHENAADPGETNGIESSRRQKTCQSDSHRVSAERVALFARIAATLQNRGPGVVLPALLSIDPAPKYCVCAPSISAPFAKMDGKLQHD